MAVGRTCKLARLVAHVHGNQYGRVETDPGALRENENVHTHGKVPGRELAARHEHRQQETDRTLDHGNDRSHSIENERAGPLAASYTLAVNTTFEEEEVARVGEDDQTEQKAAGFDGDGPQERAEKLSIGIWRGGGGVRVKLREGEGEGSDQI